MYYAIASAELFLLINLLHSHTLILFSTQTAELRKNISKLQEEIKEATSRCTEAESKEAASRHDCQEQSKVAQEVGLTLPRKRWGGVIGRSHVSLQEVDKG